MSIAEVLLADFDIEIANNRRTLERVPEDKAAYQPHEKSMRMGRLAKHCATLPRFGYYIMADEGMDLANPTRPQPDLAWRSREDCLRQLDQAAEQCRAALAAASDERLRAVWPFRFGEQVLSQSPRLVIYRQLFFNHMVHHVAQLGVYLRLNGIPVPALYGPSADEQFVPR